MTNKANRWAGKRKPALIRKVSPRKRGCQHSSCTETRPNRLRFSHVRTTPLSAKARGKPRGRKEKWADINAHTSSYRVKCKKHDIQDSRAYHSRLIKQGIRKKRGKK